MNGNDMEKKHEHKKEVVNKESTESHEKQMEMKHDHSQICLLYTSPSPRDTR